MARTVKQVMTPRASVFNAAARDTVARLGDLETGAIDPSAFFDENHFTRGLAELCKKGLDRLDGAYGNGVFDLTQSMGGGKTHSLLSFAMLAKDPDLRARILPGEGLSAAQGFGAAKVVAFDGNNVNLPFGLWGEIARQLGRLQDFAPFYSPLRAPAPADWAALIGDGPTVILLDELPIYLQAAEATGVGDSNLAVLTAIALTTLMTAVQETLPRTVVVVSNLSSGWQGGAERLSSALDSLARQTGRSAEKIVPVDAKGDDLWKILRRRLFSNAPSEADMTTAEAEMEAALKAAERGGLVAGAGFGFIRETADSYPFHPRLKELFLRFKENDGFQQTRGILRLAGAAVAALWSEGNPSDPLLIAPEDFNLSDPGVAKEMSAVNNDLSTALAADVEGAGSTAGFWASKTGLGEIPAAARTLLMASLARGQGQSVLGLDENELNTLLVRPGRTLESIKAAVEKLRSEALYLHFVGAKMYFRGNKNFVADIREEKKRVAADKVSDAVKGMLEADFKPGQSTIQQHTLVFPDKGDVLRMCVHSRVLLAVVKPETWGDGGVHSVPKLLLDLFQRDLQSSNRNRLMVMTLDKGAHGTAEEHARTVLACESVLSRKRLEGIPETDPEMRLAAEYMEKARQNLRQTAASLPSHLYFPKSADVATGLVDVAATPVDKTMKADRIESTLMGEDKALPQGWTQDPKKVERARKQFERFVFVSLAPTRREDLLRQSADAPDWIWLRPGEFERFSDECRKLDNWRQMPGDMLAKRPSPPGWPVPAPQAQIRNAIVSADEKGRGLCRVSVSVVNGDSVVWEREALPNESSPAWKGDAAAHDWLWAGFLGRDAANAAAPKGDVSWHVNPNVGVKHSFLRQPNTVLVLEAAPPRPADASRIRIFFTFDGSAPTNAQARLAYDGPTEVPAGCRAVLVVGEFDGPEGVLRTEVQKFVPPHPPIVGTGSAGAGGGSVEGQGTVDGPRIVADAPILWRVQRIDDSNGGATGKIIALLGQRNARLKRVGMGLAVGKSFGTIEFGEAEVSAGFVDRLASLVREEAGATVSSIRFNEAYFEKGEDLVALVKEMGLDLPPEEWMQEAVK